MNFGLDIGLAQDGIEILLDEIGLAFFDDQDGALADAEAFDFVVDQRIGDVENVERDFAVAESVGETQQFEAADGGVVHAALQDDAEILRAVGERIRSVRCRWMNFCAAGQRLWIFSCSCWKLAGGRTMRLTSRDRILHRIFQRELSGGRCPSR